VKQRESAFFKKCTKCGFVWPERKAFISDPDLRMIGYQADFEELMAGLFLFLHTCGTSLAISADAFQDLYDGPVFTARLNGTKECSGLCLHKNDLRPCPAKCECSYVREIVQVILKWPKQGWAQKQHNKTH
jgi:hypothetical protein